jgi:hypothetical protein
MSSDKIPHYVTECRGDELKYLKSYSHFTHGASWTKDKAEAQVFESKEEAMKISTKISVGVRPV